MRIHLVSLDLAFGVIFKVAVPLEPPLDDLSKLVCERRVVEQVVHAQSRAGGFARVGWADPFLRRSDAWGKRASEKKEKKRGLMRFFVLP